VVACTSPRRAFYGQASQEASKVLSSALLALQPVNGRTPQLLCLASGNIPSVSSLRYEETINAKAFYTHHFKWWFSFAKALIHKNSLCFSAEGIFINLTINTRSYFTAITTPEPTVLPPSRIAKRSPSSTAMGIMSSTCISTLSPGIHISTPSGSSITPVTSVVRK